MTNKNNQIVIAGVNGKNLTQQQIELVRRTVAKGADNDELTMFFHIANKQGLDPFLKEIYFYKDTKGNNIIMTSRDGFLSIATRHPDYAGLVSCEVRDGDEFEVDYSTMKVHHKHNLKDRETKKIIGAWACTYRRGTTPVVAWVDFAEFDKKSYVWKSHPAMMIRKVAEVRALKNQFGIIGITSVEEMGKETVESLQEANEEVKKELLSDDTFFRETMKAIMAEKNKTNKKLLLEKMLKAENWNQEQKLEIKKVLESL